MQLSNYSAFYKCNSAGAPSWESNCPSDLTYTPGSNGGYQAFGVGHMQVPGQDTWSSYCYWTWYWDPNVDDYVWYMACDYYYLGYVPAHSFGLVGAQIRWSQAYVNDVAGTFQLSTIALKRAAAHAGYTAFDCNPGVWFTADSRPCNPSGQDRYVVPYAGYSGTGVGYEDKILLQNLGCPWYWVRGDDNTDRNAGCYSGFDSDWWSDLPGPYKDTTKYDIGTSFLPAVGSAQVSSLQEGYIYGWYRVYWAWGLDSVTGVTRHLGGITWYSSLAPCDGVTPALCQFQVDQTNIAPYSIVF